MFPVWYPQGGLTLVPRSGDVQVLLDGRNSRPRPSAVSFCLLTVCL